MNTHPVLIGGVWRAAKQSGEFQATNPLTGETLPEVYPRSTWDDLDAALDEAAKAFDELQDLSGTSIAAFLNTYADLIEQSADEITAMANQETGYPVETRLAGAELPRTVTQLRQAGAAAEDAKWRQITIDTVTGIRAFYAGAGPVAVFGPNNFPLAFGSASGGDFAAAIAAGCPVIAKAHSGHPGTTRLFAELALKAAQETDVPDAIVQMVYAMDHADGERLVSDPRIAASAFTGSRNAGLNLKAAADKAGKPIYLELSSINPVVILPGALDEDLDQLVSDFCGSCLMGTGQFCTNPGLVLLKGGEQTDAFIEKTVAGFEAAQAGSLLSKGVASHLSSAVITLKAAGAECLTGGEAKSDFVYANTLLKVSASAFLKDSERFQTEAFGNCSLFVVAENEVEMRDVILQLEGNLTGCIYSAKSGIDDATYQPLAKVLRHKVGRLLNDKMPTGVALSPAMNHGGPYPSTGHSGFSAVGLPFSARRFGMLQSFDQVRQDRLPLELKDENPQAYWRFIDGEWTQAAIV